MATEGDVAKRTKLRERERRSRARRVAKLQQMRSTKDALERAELVLRTITDAEAVWIDFLDDHSVRVRRSLRQSVSLMNEAKMLTSERAQLRRLLREHQLASSTIAGMLSQDTTKDWTWYVQHWRDLVKGHYRPWTSEEIAEEIAAALKIVNAFQWSADKLTSGVSFLGWRELRRVDALRGAFQFQFSKTFRDHDIMDHVNAGWDSYTNAIIHNEVIVGPQIRSYHEVLQQPGPNTVIFRRAMQFQSVEHSINLVFRVRTERGFTQCVRSIRCAEVEKAIDGPLDTWPSYFTWMHWEHLDNQQNGYKLRIGGSHGLIDMEYAPEWMFRVLGAVLRSEQFATGRELITSN